MHRTIALAALAAGTALIALPAAAQAHVTVNPRALPAQSYQVLSARVPNEDDRAATTKVRLSFPAGFQSVSYEARAGWKATVARRRLARALQADDGPVTSEVALTAAESAHGSRAGRAPARAAHTGIVSRTPASGASARNVKRVSITFSQKLVTGKIDVYRGGKRVAPASSGPSGATVAARFGRKLAAGSYTAKWRAVSSDGHVQSGSWGFRIR